LGADVIKVEHPRGDDVRRLGLVKGTIPLWWKVVGRNKRLISIDLNQAEGQTVLADLADLAAQADILIENFRPGRLEKWGLSYSILSKRNPSLIMVHISGYGQTGPYSARPGFGTLAEAFSGLAHITGHPEGPPTLPAFPMADGVAALNATYAALAAYIGRAANNGRGQEIDINLYEPLLSLIGSMVIDYDQMGVVAERRGNRSNRSVPRNAYTTRDDCWLVISCTADQMAKRLFHAIGRDDLAGDPTLATNLGRVKRLEEIDRVVATWIASHDLAEALEIFDRFEVTAAPIQDVSQLIGDPHVKERGSIRSVEDPDLGAVRVQDVAARFSDTPGGIRWLGKLQVGTDTREILGELGYSNDRIDALALSKIIIS
jgi:crotonobetainyl-CoA:carnitine CoA-transferase CaiB-like acyl-CoA transferase